MIIERAMDPHWLSNTWLVADRPGGHGVLIDTGAPTDPILRAIEEHRITVTHVLCTHHHLDHVAHNDTYRARFGCPVCGHSLEAPLFGDLDRELSGNEEIKSGDMTVRALHIPGHTVGQLAFLVDEQRVFSGDTLFRRTVGGNCGPGHGTFEELRHSLLQVLLALPPETIVQPGHMESTTIAEEAAENPFLRAFQGLEPTANTSCTALGRTATLLLEARDYDGGTKCWVRFGDGTLAVVPGSRVESNH